MEMDSLMTYLQTTGTSFAVDLVAALAIFVIGRWVISLVHRLSTKAMERAKVEPLLVKFLGNILRTLLLIVGAAGLAVGLALQGSLANFAAGVLVIIFRPYKIGDYVEAGGVAGTIDDVQIFTTELKTGDNRKIIVPNGQMMSGAITNYSSHDTRRVDLVASVGYDADIDVVRRVLEEVVANDARVLASPAPNIRMSAMLDSSVNWIVRPWVKASDYWDVYWEMTEEIKRRFDAEGISIPFPQRDVHVYHHDEQKDEQGGL
jgi:small conductance mechanosensitive channel